MVQNGPNGPNEYQMKCFTYDTRLSTILLWDIPSYIFKFFVFIVMSFDILNLTFLFLKFLGRN